MKESKLCSQTIAALRATIATAQPPSSENLAHWRECSRCRGIVESAMAHLSGLEAAESNGNDLVTPGGDTSPSVRVQAAAVKAEKVMRTRKRFSAGVRAVLITVIALAIFAVVIYTSFTGAAGGKSILNREVIMSVILFIIILSGIIVGVIVAFCQILMKHKVYRRLKPGHHFGGVCLGLAESTGVNPNLLRLLFVVLTIFFFKAGLLLYLLFYLLMPIHPEDRGYLLRFRIARWLKGLWRKNSGATEASS